MEKNCYNKFGSLFLIILFIMILSINSKISFTYPYSLTLSNGNIFIIHKTGITICDAHYSKIIKNVITFSSSEEISTEGALSKITTIWDDNYIYLFSIINDKIYIFGNDGTLLSNTENSILPTGNTAQYYTLINIKTDTINFHFVIGYVYNNLIYFQYYKI